MTNTINKLRTAIEKALKDLGLKALSVEISHPVYETHGDYATSIALKVKTKNKKQKTKNPRELAQVIVNELCKNEELKKIVFKIEIAGPGFINFWLSEKYLLTLLLHSIKEKQGSHHFGKNKKLMVEYAHPNTHKLFHIGHLRNITIGESISRIFEALGNKVIRTNYQGDVGLHIAKCLYAMLKSGKKAEELKRETVEEKVELLSRFYVEGNKACEEDKNAKKEILAINKKIYGKDPKLTELWEETRQWSLDFFEKIYRRVYTKYDRFYFENEVFESGLAISKKALKSGILEESKGAVIFNGKKYDLDNRVFITKEGYPTYEGKELGLAEVEFSEFGEIDKCIHVVAPEQTSFFKVTFKVEELIDPQKYKNKQYHLSYGYVQLKKGKMSSRKGTVIRGDWLLDEVKKTIKEKFKVDSDIAEVIVVAAIKYSMLKIGTRNDLAFDIGESISLEGNSGPYLQYTYARARSVLRKSKIQNPKFQTNPKSKIQSFKLTPEEKAILRTLYRFPEVVAEAGKSFSPNLICNFLFDLAQKFNLFYQKVPILKTGSTLTRRVKDPQDPQPLGFRLALTEKTAAVIKKGLYLLGIEVLEKM